MKLKQEISSRTKSGWFVISLIASFFLFCSLIRIFPDRKPQPYILKYPSNFGGRFVIPENNPTTKEGVYLGRLLFYEKKLSAGNKISCENCHLQKLAFTDGNALSVGVNNSPTARSSMSLANLLWVRNFFWDGRSPSLETQAVFPLTNQHEMGQTLPETVSKLRKTSLYPPLFKAAFGGDIITEDHVLKALSQFERILISANSKYDKYLAGTYKPTLEEQRGMALFQNSPVPEKNIRGANCEHCHGGPKSFKELFHNNGLDSVAADIGREQFTGQASDKGRFRVPTLRNIMLTAPYMHDGRFSTIEQVLDHYNEHIRQSPTLSSFLIDVSNQKGGKTLLLTTSEKSDINSFLAMLTDSAFITNPEFSNPHLILKSQ
ncbi:cytochrome-c peroxidase [Dyadobacter frigoris]|uniref:Cytochrome-c peroxidase n=1 Tax=Dyadobacter frigoris TaxID=2576211 RepID=A0A4U6CX44_9BACT|nr:cytochrome c peroxidase [Dyadobacter frigoris]TKT89400.1 cytochrome-c peroxidase [Dyadobacter frigoris]GLU55460.1 cytochrome-c peroxidase [Dyadobacter frigoris]